MYANVREYVYLFVWRHTFERVQYNFEDIEENTIDDLDLPEIHGPHNLTTRVMLTVPQLVGNVWIY